MTRPKRDAPRLLHIADVHLGAGFPWLGERGAAHRRRLRQTFADALTKGTAEGMDLLLVAGGLFGSSRPHPELADFVRAQLSRLAGEGISTVIAAGEADTLDLQGGYAGGSLDGLPGTTILPAASKVVEFPALTLSVSGRSAVKGKEITDPFKGLAAGKARTVGMVAVDPRRSGSREALARAANATGFAYLALGGNHRTLDLGADKVPAWYPGSLDLLARSDPPGAALLVDLDRDPVRVTPVPVARGRVQRLTLEPAAYSTLEALTAEIEALADPDLLLEVRLGGRALPAQFIDVLTLEQSLAPRFFGLEIADEAVPDSAAAPPGGPGGTVTVPGKFAELMASHLQQAGSEAERRRIALAHRLGLWLLAGRGGRP